MINLFFLLCFSLFLHSFFIFICRKIPFLKKNHKTLVGEQQIHKEFTPRIGGLVIFCILIIFSYIESALEIKTVFNQVFLASMLPLVIITIREDLFLNTKPIQRLIGILVSSSIIIVFLIPQLPLIELPFLSQIINMSPVNFIFFILALTLLINGMNLIDGANGLSGFTSLATIVALGIIARMSNDSVTVNSCLIYSVILLSFLVFNYPFGKIFFGDTGAYLNGLIIGYMIINFYGQHPEIPTWSAVLFVLYPIVEVIFSFFRKVLSRRSPFYPDSKHLHIKLYNILNKGMKDKHLNSNYLITPFLSILWLGPPMAAIISFTSISISIYMIILFLFLYGFIYKSIPYK
jgi:UDP-GlcNAc:undecaprenyl-phosphate/decaprenyl-phosphate GlcNAc-1-phosphate transferase